MKFRSLSLYAGVCGLIASSSFAFVSSIDANGHLRRWNLESTSPEVPAGSVNRSTKAIRYFLSAETAHVGLEESERNSVRAAFGQWQAVPGARVRFEDAGLVSGPDINTTDGTNLVFWAKSELVNGGHDSIAGRIAVTFFRTVTDNELAEADIVFNNVGFHWFSDYNDKANGNYFIEATALHEVGHFLGLDHSPAGGATLFVRSLTGVTPEAGLSADELAAARALYPPVVSNAGTLAGTVLMNGAPVLEPSSRSRILPGIWSSRLRRKVTARIACRRWSLAHTTRA